MPSLKLMLKGRGLRLTIRITCGGVIVRHRHLQVFPFQ